MGRELERRVEGRVQRTAQIALEEEGPIAARAERVARIARDMLGVDIEYVSDGLAGAMAHHTAGKHLEARADLQAAPPMPRYRTIIGSREPAAARPWTWREPALSDLGVCHRVGSQSRVEATIVTSDGDVLGRYCCPQGPAADRDVRLVRMLARLVARQADRERWQAGRELAPALTPGELGVTRSRL
jgi:hypothetical protein